MIVIDLEVFGSNHAGQHLENCPASVSDLKSQVDAASRYIVDPITGPKEDLESPKGGAFSPSWSNISEKEKKSNYDDYQNYKDYSRTSENCSNANGEGCCYHRILFACLYMNIAATTVTMTAMITPTLSQKTIMFVVCSKFNSSL